MAVSTKTIKGRIRSVSNTRKITKAMEMVAAAKMRKAVEMVLASRQYADTAWQTVRNLTARINPERHPLLQPHAPINKTAIILISANRGLCGGFNSHVVAEAERYRQNEKKAGATTDTWLVMGKKGGYALVRNQRKIEAEFDRPDVVKGVTDITDLAQIITDGFRKKNYDRVAVVYTDFISPLVQKPRVRILLPLQPEADDQLGQAKKHGPDSAGNKPSTPGTIEYLFEPSPDEVLNQLLPRLIEIQLYQALLESTAAEHSARMLAMKNASDAARDMIDELTLIYNQARQASITREIAEISGGKAALEE